MNNITFIVGARPNFIKLFPLYNELKKINKYDLSIINTGQHSDYNMSTIFFEQFNLPTNITNLNIESKTQISQISEILSKLDNLPSLKTTNLIIVFGDVTSSLAGALFANKSNIKLAHVESGNRSFDRTMPEEINRILIDNLSDYLFISEPNAIINLKKENITHPYKYYVGNVMIDSLNLLLKTAISTDTYLKFNLNNNNYILLTLHRPSNIDNETSLSKITSLLKTISSKYKLIYPIHPRNKKIYTLLQNTPNIILCEPQNYLNFINLMYHSALVITDSGGIQEETTAINKQCITFRKNTERPITCTQGSNQLYDIDSNSDILEIIKPLYGNIFKKHDIPLWDGHASSRITEIISNTICV